MWNFSGKIIARSFSFETSKHSQYQILASSLDKIISGNSLNIQSRYDKEWLKYVLKKLILKINLSLTLAKTLDIFLSNLLKEKSALIIEGNKTHSNFVQESGTTLGWQQQVEIDNDYTIFDKELSFKNIDTIILLNMLHHTGGDYGCQIKSLTKERKSILDSLNYLSHQAKHLVFQLGFNWKGDIKHPLFNNDTKRKLIDFIESGTKEYWSVEYVGIVERSSDGTIKYNDVNSINIKRIYSLGEFLNRPLFIMKSKLYRNNAS